MGRTTIAITGTAFAAVALLGAAPAQAAEQHHGHDHATKAEKRHDRKVEARQERRAAHKPAQGTTTTPAVPVPTGGRTAKPTPPRAAHGVVSCAVTADRAGASFLIHNGCDTPQTVTVSLQAQPGPWHRGLCTAGGCHLLARYDVTVAPGSSTITVATGGACYVQADVKWDGQLIRSNHYVNDCMPPKPVPPVAHPTPRPPVLHQHRAPHARVRLTSAPTSSAITGLPRTGGNVDVLGYLGFGLLTVGGCLMVATRHQPKRGRK